MSSMGSNREIIKIEKGYFLLIHVHGGENLCGIALPDAKTRNIVNMH